ncbi:MAG: response regulator, partial [Gammaproteobacteria bacterium]
LNLISNALKFTEKGQIVVSLKLPKDASDKDDVCMSVRDTGIGIPVTKLETIFESFTQADTSTTRRYGGTGLGLTICRHLVTLMNGQIWVESEEGKGSEFFVKVNLAQQDKPRVVPPDLTDKSILIVDSRLDNCLALEETLKYCGANCVNATTVKNCVNYLTNQQEPDIVIVDSHMLLDESMELKSAFSDELKQKTLVTISPSYMTRHQSVVERDGYRKILMKPLKRVELLDAIRSMYKRTSKEDVDKIIKPIADDNVAKSLHILLVEDNPDNRMLIRAYLKKTDHILDEAENGEIALDRFMSKKYDMVFMDIQMPVMDGHEATKRIRAWEQKNNKEKTPIIALTAHAIKEEIDKCIASGCDSHLGKPVKKATLLEAIQGIG